MTPLAGNDKFIITSANFEDIYYILNHMRDDDKKEIFATEFDDDMKRVAEKFSNHCELNWIFCLPDATPVAFLAASRLWPHFAQIGFAATNDWSKIAIAVSKWLKPIRKQIFNHFNVNQAICFVDDNHKQSQRWLKWLGFYEKCRLPEAGRNGESFLIYLLKL